jgi:hypothetical protein
VYQVESDENVFMGGVVFQFFGMLSVHMFRLCRCMHAKFTKAADFDVALAYFRSVVQKDTTELLGASVPLAAVVPTAAIVDPNDKAEADNVVNEGTAAPAGAVVEHQCSTGSWEPVTHVRHRVQKISALPKKRPPPPPKMMIRMILCLVRMIVARASAYRADKALEALAGAHVRVLWHCKHT